MRCECRSRVPSRSRFLGNAPGNRASPFEDRARRLAWPARGTERFLGRRVSNTPWRESGDNAVGSWEHEPARARRAVWCRLGFTEIGCRCLNHPGADESEASCCEKRNRLQRLRRAKTTCKGRRGRNVAQPLRGIEPPCRRWRLHTARTFHEPSRDGFFDHVKVSALERPRTILSRFCDHRIAMLVHQGSDPTSPYPALVIRESAKFYEGFSPIGSKAFSVRRPAPAEQKPLPLTDLIVLPKLPDVPIQSAEYRPEVAVRAGGPR